MLCWQPFKQPELYHLCNASGAMQIDLANEHHPTLTREMLDPLDSYVRAASLSAAN